MRQTLLQFHRPSIGEEEIAEVVDTLRSDWLTTGPKVKRFEQEFAAAVDAPAALAVSSCTAALHLALVAQGIGPGDSVITTPMTFCSTVRAIEQVGATPILVDVDPATLNIDPGLVADRAEKMARFAINRLRAILPVHLYGLPAEMSALLDTAQRHGLVLLEDAAHALPAAYRGRPVGSQHPGASVPQMTCFSFYATKCLTTGEGGMLTGIPETIEAARRLSLHGMSRDALNRYSAEGSWHYEVDRAGFKFNMTDIQAAIGLHQLRKQGAFLARRAEIARRYNAAFSIEECVQIPARPAHLEHAWHIYSLRLRLDRLTISRDEFIEELAARKISASVHFIPVHLHPYFRDRYGYKPENMPTAFREYLRILSLPIFPSMTDEDVEDVIEAVAEIARKHRRQRLIPAQQGRPSMRGIPADRVIRASRIKSGLRRAFDMFASASGLLLLAPLLGIIALAIKWQDGGPVLYVQSRVGRGFRKFQLYKFRSMVADAPSSMPLAGPDDPRITRVGKFLRKHKLDELPQLLNVLKGEMQLVGVRPQLERYVLIFPDEYRDLLQERPGITDLASLKFRNEEQMFRPGSLDEQYVQQILPEKLRLALKYRRARTFVSDLGILFRTVLGFKSPSIN